MFRIVWMGSCVVTRLVVEQHLRAFIGFSAMLFIAGGGVANLTVGWW